MEPEAASEKAITAAGLVRHTAELVRRGTFEDGVASGCTKVLARLHKGGKILTAESTLLYAEPWMTGASLAERAELQEAELWYSLLCLTSASEKAISDAYLVRPTVELVRSDTSEDGVISG